MTPTWAWSIAAAMPARLDDPLVTLIVTALPLPTWIAIEPEPRLPLELDEPEEIRVSALARWMPESV